MITELIAESSDHGPTNAVRPLTEANITNSRITISRQSVVVNENNEVCDNSSSLDDFPSDLFTGNVHRHMSTIELCHFESSIAPIDKHNSAKIHPSPFSPVLMTN